MRIDCCECKYSSGEYDTLAEAKAAVKGDGGRVVTQADGLHVHCPKGHTKTRIEVR